MTDTAGTARPWWSMVGCSSPTVPVAGPPRSALATHLFAGLGFGDLRSGSCARGGPLKTRITEMLGIEIPIVQAPMGWIARSPLAPAVSNAGGLGIIETSSGDLDTIKGEIAAMRTLTDKPFGVNLAQMFIRDLPGMVDFVTQNEISFVTTSAGDPSALAPQLKDWASRCSTSCRRSGAPRRRSPQGSTVWLSKVRKAEGSRMPTVHRPSCWCPRSPSVSTCRSSPQAALSTAPRWRQLWPWGPTASRWAPAWWRPPSRRSTTTGNSRS